MHEPWQGDRGQWLTLCRQLVDAARRHAAADGASIDLPGAPSRHGTQSDGLEGFSRVFLTYAFGAAADDSPFDEGDAERWRAGIVAGLSGEPGERRWPEAHPKGHSIVDAGYLALALRVLGRDFLAPMQSPMRDRLVDWLESHARAECPSNNWVLFRCAIASALRQFAPERASSPEIAELVAESYRALDDWYDESTGWYSDGDARTADYYNAFELHFVPTLLAHLDDDAEARSRYGARLARFLPSLRAMVDARGLPVYFGRSLTYRFAIGAPFALGALVAVDDEQSAIARERLNGMVRAFLTRGACEVDGTLGRGWFGGQPELAQEYSGPASAYFAGRAFVSLLMPRRHPFWADELPEQHSTPRRVISLPHQPHWLIDPAEDGALVRLVNHGSTERVGTIMRRRFDDPMYSRLAYSSATAPAEAENESDRSVSIVVDGQPCSRGIIVPNAAGARWASSWSHPRMLSDRPVTVIPDQYRGDDLDDLVVHHLTALVDGWHVDVTAVVGRTSRVQQVIHGGWAVPDAGAPHFSQWWGRHRVRLRSAHLDAEFVALRARQSLIHVRRSTLAQPFGATADFGSLVQTIPARTAMQSRRPRPDAVLWMISASSLEVARPASTRWPRRPPRVRGRHLSAALGRGVTVGRGDEALRIVLDDAGLRAER